MPNKFHIKKRILTQNQLTTFLNSPIMQVQKGKTGVSRRRKAKGAIIGQPVVILEL